MQYDPASETGRCELSSRQASGIYRSVAGTMVAGLLRAQVSSALERLPKTSEVQALKSVSSPSTCSVCGQTQSNENLGGNTDSYPTGENSRRCGPKLNVLECSLLE